MVTWWRGSNQLAIAQNIDARVGVRDDFIKKPALIRRLHSLISWVEHKHWSLTITRAHLLDMLWKSNIDRIVSSQLLPLHPAIATALCLLLLLTQSALSRCLVLMIHPVASSLCHRSCMASPLLISCTMFGDSPQSQICRWHLKPIRICCLIPRILSGSHRLFLIRNYPWTHWPCHGLRIVIPALSRGELRLDHGILASERTGHFGIRHLSDHPGPSKKKGTIFTGWTLDLFTKMAYGKYDWSMTPTWE